MGIARSDQTWCIQPGGWILQWHSGFCDMWASEQAGRGWSTTVYQIKADVPLFERWAGGPSPLKSVLKCVNLGNVASRYIYLRLCCETSLTNRLPWWLSCKEPTWQCRRRKRLGFDPWVRKIPWRRQQRTQEPIVSSGKWNKHNDKLKTVNIRDAQFRFTHACV